MSIADKAWDKARKSPNRLLVVLILVHLVLFSLNRIQSQPQLRVIQQIALTIAAPFQSGLGTGADWFSRLWSSYFQLRGVREENQRLRSELARSDAEKLQLREKLATLRQLEQLLASESAMEYDRVPARVIGRDTDHLFGTVIIDKGSRHGIIKDQPVIDSGGLVGRVVLVASFSSRVILLTDERHGAGAIITSSLNDGSLGVIKGVGDSYLCRMDFITTPVQVENGVQILTSGQDGIYPRGLLIGRVSNPPELVGSTQQRLVVEPAANLGRLEMVLVLQIPPEKIRAKIDDVAEEERRLETESLRKR